MNIAVLGTGLVGRTLAARLNGLGHDVAIGTRDVQATLGRSGEDALASWLDEHPGIRLMSFADAGDHADVLVNVTHGAFALDALAAVGEERMRGKILLDLALPLDFSQGMPPTLLVANSDSLGEQIQRTYPDTRVVKALHTMFVAVMVEPSRVPGSHNVFVAGEDSAAKALVEDLLRAFGWPDQAIIDLGGIRASRATEMYSRLFFELAGVFGDYDFNIAVVR